MYKQQSIKSYKHSRRGQPGCFVQKWCMQQKVHLLNVNIIGQNMGVRSTVIHCSTDCDTVDVLVPRQGYSYQTDREPLPH